MIVLLTLSGCNELVFTIRNETPESLVVFGVDDAGVEHHIEDLLPGQASGIRGHLDPSTDCTSLTLVAENEDGEFVASREPPTCDGDEWIIHPNPP
jgi:hypothetical protein